MTIDAQLGPFRLEQRLGAGGMGVVYRGQHVETGVPVAVKAIRSADVEPGSQRQFHREVQAHAGLQHPGVVYLFEYGTVDAATSAATDGDLPADSPYVAMELADRGTVREQMPLEDWPSVCEMLVQVLDALAYSHARGVVHRDLKPENFLLFDPDADGESDWRVKLADFGIAHAIGGEREADTQQLAITAGTPYYMAPEQVTGEWRRYGPWTDLYALGCIAWELVCGRPPFTGETSGAIAMSHCTDDLPSFDPMFPVPGELENWVRRAMAKSPSRRFRRAADAAWALPRAALAEGDADTTPSTDADRDTHGPDDANPRGAPGAKTAPQRPAPTVTLTELAETASADSTLDEVGGAGPAPVSEHDELSIDTPPPIPEQWAPEQGDSLPAPLVGAGLGLFGLREPPFVNRREECGHIWSALREVLEERTMRTAFVAGEPGTGKSRLAEWIATRAHEVGAVRVVRAIHTAGGGPQEGLAGAVDRALRTVKFDRGEVYDHLRDNLPALPDREGDEEWRERDARALAEFLRPTDDSDPDDGPAYRFSSPGQKYGLVVRTLERLGRHRPVLLWIDDLQWATEALGLLEHLVDQTGDPPELLTLATLRSDIVREDERLESRLDELQSSEQSTRVDLEPLSRTHQRELLVNLLPLEDALADRLAERTEGHPLFAMQVIAHWIDSDAIEMGPDGFGVTEGRELELPEDIHQLWRRRLARLTGEMRDADPETLERAIERAAALGREVDDTEWRAVCDDLAIGDPEAVRDRLVERGLAERSDRGWAFAHRLGVESLERQAREHDRWRTHHRRCVEVLETLYPDRPGQTAARRANHHVAAGDLEEALAPLLEEAERLHESGIMPRAGAVLERRRRILDTLDVPDDDPRCLENDVWLARANILSGTSPDTILESLETTLEHAESTGSDRLLARVWQMIALCRRGRRELSAADSAARRATEHAEACGDAEILVELFGQWGWLAYLRGDLEGAERKFTEARSRARQVDDLHGELTARRGMAWIAVCRGDEARATRLFELALDECREAGFRSLEAICANGLGEIARFAGDADEARRRYRQYGELAREQQLPEEVGNAHMNLAQVEILAGRLEAADHQLDRARQIFESIPRPLPQQQLVRLSRVAWAAAVNDWKTFDNFSDRVIDELDEEQQGRLFKDYPWLAELAGDKAAEAGERARAERIWRLARDLWEGIDELDGRERVEAKLE